MRSSAHRRHSGTFLVALNVLMLAFACEPVSSADRQPEPTRVRVTPTSVSLDPGATQQFDARVEDQNGAEMAGSFEWSATGGTISVDGLYTAGDSPGSYRVIARESDVGLADTAEVDVGASGGAISNVRFDWSTYQRLAGGSDNWPLTWCEDGHQYTAWGDGGGFGGTNQDGRVSLGFARIEGDYPDFTGINVWGGMNPENPAQFGGKSRSMLCINGSLYAWRSDGSNTGSLAWKQIIRSTDKGAHWEEDAFPRSRLEGCVGCPGLPFFINYGQNYTANADGYVYVYSIRISDPNSWEVQNPGVMWLARAPVSGEAFGDTANWEWLTGGEPTWGNRADRVPVLTDADGFMRSSALYVPGLNRYVMVTNHTARNLGNIAFWESPQPWGPWRLVWKKQGWPSDETDVVDALFAFGNFSPKWLSPDGRDCVFVWFQPDAWNSVACEFETAP